MAVFDDTQAWPDKLLLYPHQITWQNNIPVPVKAEPERLDIPQAEPLRMECEHFLQCMTNAQQPSTDGAEGLRVLRVLNAAQRSLDEGGRRIEAGRQREDRTIRTAGGMDGVSTGDRGHREKLTSDHRQPTAGFFVHETAVVDDACEIGVGTKIWHFSHVLSNSTIGENCNIGQNVVIGPDVTIGKGCKIQNNVSVYKGVTLEDDVFCGPSMVFTNIINPRAEIRKMYQVRPTLVRKGATLGANSTIIGRYAFIGTGSVVTKNVSDHALVVGNPAEQIGWACQCGERLTDKLECLSCSRKYELSQKGTFREYQS
ncbi:MAG: acyltransferase [Deltaproteobacteria bacterium]|nr:acyltransferase [Deltaproteobacteria bacterium]